MTSLVVDTSALLDYLFQAESAEILNDLIEAPETELHVPHLCDIEFLAGLRKELARRTLSMGDAILTLVDYADLALQKHGHESLMLRILELRENLGPYDASFVALAERLGVPLVTLDQRQARAARTHTNVEVLPQP